MKCFMAQTRLPSHIEVQNTKMSGLQHSCKQFRKKFNFVRLKMHFQSDLTRKNGDRNCALIKYFQASKCLNISVLSQTTTV